MKNADKYERQDFLPPVYEYDWVKKDYIEKAPSWCSVDLCDENEAFIESMNLEEKLNFFQMLVEMGLKEIAVGSPAASETEFLFVRTLIERNMIPEDVTIQVLTQIKEPMIKRTVEAVKGISNVVIHLRHSTSILQGELKKEKEQRKQLAIEGVSFLKQLTAETEGTFTLEYSLECFYGAEAEYAAEACDAVLDVWQPNYKNKAIINILPTVEIVMPHLFAMQVEYISKHLKDREHVILSLRPRNDRSRGISDAELGILAGAERIEGTLFGDEERIGTVDLQILAMNLFAYGVEPELDFSNLPIIRHGKNSVSYILKQKFSISLPEKMREEVGYAVKRVSDTEHKELSPQWVYEIFEENYIHYMPYFQITSCYFKQEDGIMAEATIVCGEKKTIVDANGNGHLDAVSSTIKQFFNVSYEVAVYEEHALSRGSSSKAMAYVGIAYDGKIYWGAGMNEDIIKASIHALVVAVNKLPQIQKDESQKDDRLVAMLNFIQTNYHRITLEDMAKQFHLSEPYISKYIKDKSGKTFGEHVTGIRMKRAKTLLKNGNMTVENISYAVGYQNVEHFNRTFKKSFAMTPMQYRNISREG